MVYPRKKRSPSWKALKRIKDQAERLGTIVVHKPAARRADGSPLLREGEVYVTTWGQRYHIGWCQVVADKWDKDPRGLFVSYLSDVGGRTECGSCDTPLTSSTVPVRTSTEKLDREYAEKKARIAAGERRRNGG